MRERNPEIGLEQFFANEHGRKALIAFGASFYFVLYPPPNGLFFISLAAIFGFSVEASRQLRRADQELSS